MISVTQKDSAMNPIIKNTLIAASPLAVATAIHAEPKARFLNVAPSNGTVVDTPRTVLRGKISHDVYQARAIRATINGSPLAIDPQGNFTATVDLRPGNNDFTLRAATPNPRQQITNISAYLDGSMIYGSDAARANALRTFKGGALRTCEGNLPPLNTAGSANANDAHLYPDDQLFLCGDVRANENLELTSIHALFIREHNLIAAAITAANPQLGDEQIYH